MVFYRPRYYLKASTYRPNSPWSHRWLFSPWFRRHPACTRYLVPLIIGVIIGIQSFNRSSQPLSSQWGPAFPQNFQISSACRQLDPATLHKQLQVRQHYRSGAFSSIVIKCFRVASKIFSCWDQQPVLSGMELGGYSWSVVPVVHAFSARRNLVHINAPVLTWKVR